MTQGDEVPAAILNSLRNICLALPESFEEPAWRGTRWKIRSRTFAHVLRIHDGRPEAYAKVSGVHDSAVVLTFRADEEEVAALAAAGLPFFLPGWWPNIVGVIVDGSVDDGELAELLTESYCLLAPRKLTMSVRGDA